MCSFRYNKNYWWILVVSSLFILTQAAFSFGWVVPPNDLVFFNRSASLPMGYYLSLPLGTLKEGDLVLVDLPQEMELYAVDRGWMEHGEMLLKKIGGLEGDSYYVDDRIFEIDGKYIGPVYEKDSQGLPMPVLRGNFVVKEGYFLPVADRRPNSFDGRYFGDVPLASIKGKVVPLWTEGLLMRMLGGFYEKI